MSHGFGDLPGGFVFFHFSDDHAGQIIGGEHAEEGHAGRDAELFEGRAAGQ